MIALVPVDPKEAVVQRFAHFRRTALKVTTDLEADLAEWFGFRPGEARLVAVLYRSGGPVQLEYLMTMANVNRETLRQYVARAREALGEGAIPFRSTNGEDDTYTLTQLGRSACDEAVAKVGVAAFRKEVAA